MPFDVHPQLEAELEELSRIPLISDDGEPLESDWHRKCMTLLIASVACRLRDRTDYYVGGNMFLYFDKRQSKNHNFRGPDFFFVDGVSLSPPRLYWAVWEEGGRYPDVIIELSSPSTVEIDHAEKFRVYEETFRTSNYFIYDPQTQLLEGWELVARRYQPLSPNAEGRLHCSALDLWLGEWDGNYLGHNATWLRFFDADGHEVPVMEEYEHREAEQAKREMIRARRDAERAQRDTEKAQRDAEQAQRDMERERKRADAAETEVAQLRALLAQQKPNGSSASLPS